jgi:hypothetical protein
MDQEEEDAPRDVDSRLLLELLWTVVLVDLKACADNEERLLFQAKNASEQYARVLRFMKGKSR